VNVRMLMDMMVRQTTVLLAQLATTGGLRAPLAHIANQVFLDLVGELEAQGLGRKVIADMFGMALRSYQQKVQRLSESATDDGVSLWEAVYKLMREREVASRAEVLKHFKHDNEASVRGILHDLVESGLLYRSGRGQKTIYRVAPEGDVLKFSQGELLDSQATLVWLSIYRLSPVTLEALKEELPLEELALRRALGSLLHDGRVQTALLDGQEVYRSESCLIPMGDEVGWEVGLFDHFQAVMTSIVLKLQNGSTRALPSDQIGGSTFRFDIWPGHPDEEEVRGLLSRFRGEVGELWDRVSARSQQEAGPADKQRVTFYFGQSIRDEPAPCAEEGS
jgi:hypothetical protein